MKAQFNETNLITVAEARKLTGRLIYALCDAEGEAFYVGKTTKPSQRFYMHNRNLNLHAARKYNALADAVRVSILCMTPEDIDAEERKHIELRPWTMNIVTPGHWRWGEGSEPVRQKPWLINGKCPSSYAIKMFSNRGMEVKNLIKVIDSIPKENRLLFEMDAYTDLPPLWRIRLEPWIGEAVVRFDETYTVTAAQRREVQRRFEAVRVSSREELASAGA